MKKGRRAFLLNPPADIQTDTDAVERHTVRCILDALDGSSLEKVVAASTIGARAGERMDDLNVLHELEQGLAAQAIPATVQRGAYYMSNWDVALKSAREDGVVQSFIPAAMKVPMVAPHDLGQAAARWLLQPVPETAPLHTVEGPARYSPADVAAAFADALGKPVKVQEVPRDRWVAAYREMGFSAAAADSYARMIGICVDEGFAVQGPTVRGETTLARYVRELVSAPVDPAR